MDVRDATARTAMNMKLPALVIVVALSGVGCSKGPTCVAAPPALTSVIAQRLKPPSDNLSIRAAWASRSRTYPFFMVTASLRAGSRRIAYATWATKETNGTEPIYSVSRDALDHSDFEALFALQPAIDPNDPDLDGLDRSLACARAEEERLEGH